MGRLKKLCKLMLKWADYECLIDKKCIIFNKRTHIPELTVSFMNIDKDYFDLKYNNKYYKISVFREFTNKYYLSTLTVKLYCANKVLDRFNLVFKEIYARDALNGDLVKLIIKAFCDFDKENEYYARYENIEYKENLWKK